MTIASHT